MLHSLSPLPRHIRVATHALVRGARSRFTAATAGIGALLAGLTLLLTPRPAAAMPSDEVLYEMCLDAVQELAERCLNSSDNWAGDLACQWAGGAGYIVCAVLEAGRRLIPGGLPAA